MGDVITRFKLETTQFDSKLRDSAKSLTQLTQQLQIAGKDFDRFASQHVAAARSLGEVASGATNLKDKLKDLVGAYNQVAKAYNELSEEQKGTDFGKAMAESLQKLQVDIKNTKAEMNAVPGALDQLASKFTLNVDAIKLFNIGMQAAEGVLSIAKDAFFSSESNIDEWGRSVEGAKGAYDVFLQTINGGNWSDFFTNLSTAVQGARDLYDALDRLGSVKSNNQAAIAIQQQQVAQLRLMKQQGQNVDEQLKAATERLAYLQNQAVEAGKNAGSKMSFETLKNEINANNKNGVSISDDRIRFVVAAMQRGGQDVFDQYKREEENLSKKAQDTRRRQYTGAGGVSYSYNETFTNLDKLTEEEQRRYLIAHAATEAETRIQKGLSIYAQAVSEGAAAAREQFKGNRYALQGTGGSKTNPADQAADKFAQAQKDYQQALELAATQLKAGTANDVEYEKKKLAAEESLWKSIGDAREKYDNPKYKEAQDQAAARILELGGSVKALTEQQDAAKKAIQQAEAAYKKEADAADKMADYVFAASKAVDNNDLKGFYAANKGLSGMGAGTMDVPVSFTYTDTNLQAFIGKLKEDIGGSDVGSDLYNKLTEQLNDATALGNLFQTAIANGVDAAQLSELGNAIFQKIFSGENIDSEIFKSFAQLLSDSTGKNISVEGSGKVTEKEDKTFQDFIKGLQSVTSGLSSVTTGLKSLGVEIPAELDNLMSTINAVGQIISGVQQIISVFQTSAIAANTAAVTANTIALGVNSGSNVAAGAGLAGAAAGASIGAMGGGWIGAAIGAGVGFLAAKLFSNGGIVHAANGFVVPGNSLSGDNVPALLNSGEVVLNHSQVNNLANALEGNGLQNLNLEARIEAEDIVLTMNNNSERWGGGEYVTSK